MYKKILVALCFVISLFFIVPIIYLLWNKESYEEPLAVKGPFIAIFLRNDYKTINDSHLLLHDEKNSEYVIDRSIIWDTEPGFVGQIPRKKSIRFECHANVNVKWIFHGEGGLVSDVKHHNKREIKDFQNPSTYWFETVLEFFNLSEQITGKYICQAYDEPQVSNFVYIYGKGDTTFIRKDEVRLEVDPDNAMIVPCPVSDPEKEILLREVIQPLDRTISREVDKNLIISFNPQIGFKLHPNNWGSYLCIDPNSETSGIVKLFKPRRFIVRGDFLTKSATNVPQNHTSLKVLCEASEEITLNFINFAKFKRRQVYFQNKTSDFEFTSRIKLRTEYFTNYSTVECVTVRDNRVLRVWKFLKNEWSDKPVFSFNNFSKGYECCVDNVETNPKLTQATCFTQTECEMKRSCLKLENKCPYIQILNQPIYEGKPGCSLAKVENNPSGILECSYGNFSKSYLYFYSKRNGFHNFTSSDFRKKKVPVEKMIEVVQRQSQSQGTLMKNDTVTFDCFGPKFFLANGFQWALKKYSGSVEYIINKSQPDEESVETLHESINIPLEDVTGKTVTCIAPLLNSNEWVNASTRYKKHL